MVTLSCTLPETHRHDTAQQIETEEVKERQIAATQKTKTVGNGEIQFILFTQAGICLFPALLPVVL